MKQGIKNTILLVLILVMLLFTGLILNFFSNSGAKAFKNANTSSMNIKNEIIDSLNLLTAEAEYEEIITRKETWVMGWNPSLARVKISGSIKMGSELIDVKNEGDKYIISLSEPEILQHDFKKQGQWETREGILNEFDPIIEGEIFQNSKKLMEGRLFNELRNRCLRNNELAVYSILNKYTKEEIGEENCQIVYMKK